MLVTPAMVIQLLIAFFEAMTAFGKWAITPAGQRTIDRMLADDEQRRKAWTEFVGWVQDLFTGKLFVQAGGGTNAGGHVG